MPPSLPPESHYDPKKLDKIFAIVTIVLLFSLIGLFAKDYSRDWKNYQRQFRALEVEKARVKMDAEQNSLAANADYQSLLKSMADAQTKLNAQGATVKVLKAQIAAIEAVKRLHTKESQDTKAAYDALKYRYEVAANSEAKNAQELRIDLDTMAAKIERFKVRLEGDEKELLAKNAALKVIEKDFRDLDKKRMGMAQKQEILSRKLKRIDEEAMTPANQLAEHVRDLPIIDLANPNYKIRQIVLKDIPEDVNFMKVQRVDRCTTCHLGIDNPDFKDAAQPFRSHPNLELFMDKNSPHPLESFGCTTCHQGRGRGTDFTSAAHTPQNEEQEKEWQKKYHWEELHHWEQPMYPVQFTQAGCFKCHEDQGMIKGAEKLNLGLALIDRAGCYGCHDIAKYKKWPKSGPSLEFLASKTTKAWAYQWIWDPKSIRHNTWMPSYFNQSNNNDVASIKRSQQEVHAIVTFLFANSKPYKAAAPSETGDEVKGKELVSSLGCLACHQVEPNKKDVTRDRDQLHREFGPNLIGLGSKTDVAWLVEWLKDPTKYHPNSKMPNMRLSDQEAADIAAYLSKDKSAAVNKPTPMVDENLLNTIVLDFMKKSFTREQAQDQLKGMDKNAKLQYAGRLLVREYGCYACHNIPGFENEKPIGVELTEEGSKSIHRLDFGFVNIEHSKQAWFKQKLMNPRAYDKGRVLQPLERIKMPNFNFKDEEAEAITTALLGFVKDRPAPSKMANQGVGAPLINEGRRVIRQLNCQACHVIEGDGGAVKDSINQWLKDYQGKTATEAANFVSSFSPPRLLGEGAKVQAQWMFDFLNQPTKIRPWLAIRMPSYNFHASQANSIVKYFNYLDHEEFPFTDVYHPNLSKEEFQAAEKLFSKEVFGCTLCHVVGDQMPSGTQDTWAPNLALAKRLKPDWIIKWITNPSAVLPGTKMPTFYDPNTFETAGPPNILEGNSHKQIKALRDYLLTISANPELYKKDAPKPATKVEKATEAPTPAPAVDAAASSSGK